MVNKLHATSKDGNRMAAESRNEENYMVFTDDKGRKGVKRNDGIVIVPANYDEIKYHNISEGLTAFAAIATRDGKDYLIDSTGKAVFEADELKPNLASICPAVFRVDGRCGMVNSRGEVTVDVEYDWIKPDANGFCFIGLDGKEGFIAPTGDVIEPVYDSVEIDSDDYIVVTLGGKKGYIDELDEFTENRDEAYYNFQMSI